MVGVRVLMVLVFLHFSVLSQDSRNTELEREVSPRWLLTIGPFFLFFALRLSFFRRCNMRQSWNPPIYLHHLGLSSVAGRRKPSAGTWEACVSHIKDHTGQTQDTIWDQGLPPHPTASPLEAIRGSVGSRYNEVLDHSSFFFITFSLSCEISYSRIILYFPCTDPGLNHLVLLVEDRI